MVQILNKKQLVELVLASYEAERTHDVDKNLTLVSDDFKFTDLTLKPDGGLFPTYAGNNARDLMRSAFSIEGREFVFKSIAADEESQTVFVEFIESYPDPKTGKVYRTPQVAICQIKDGKIHRTRHYMDPRLSYEYLSKDQLEKAFE